MDKIKLLPAGDRALIAEFGCEISPAINDSVNILAKSLTEAGIPGIGELIPTFRSLLIHYDPAQIQFEELAKRVKELAAHPKQAGFQTKRILEIPCCYGSHFGWDLEDMSRYTGLSREEIIFLHSCAEYRVYMLGFLPGFVYLGGLDQRLEIPRIKTPRIKIPAGAVGIGGNQTGVYPLDSPGGWRLIGSTPVDFYDPCRTEPVLCRAGDRIRFVPVTSCDYYDIRREILRGSFQLSVQFVREETTPCP